jgi:hypothetical protein
MKRFNWLDYILIKKSGLFDDHYYLRVYPDCRLSDVNPLVHYLQHGYHEGRNPSASFDTNFYIESNPDVRLSDTNPLVHYVKHGQKEGRLIRPPLHRSPQMMQ